MLSKFSYTQKTKFLLPVFVVGLLLCWFLAFSKTFDAIQFNGKLTEESVQENDMSFNPVYLQRKLDALEALLKGYEVGEQWNDQLWMVGSSIAAKRNVGVDYTAARQVNGTDSTAVGLVQSLYFYGDYKQLVQLIDTMERSSRIGKISALQVKAPKPDLLNERTGKNVLRLDFKAMKK